MATIIKDLGAVSAYAYAVEKGYTGTEAEFAELMADYADVGQRAEDAAESALNSKTAAQTAAQTATAKASEASTSATNASSSASAASASASAASGSATSAANSATAAAGSATTATTKASEASASATAAQTAQTAAETAQGKAEDAQEAAEEAAESVSASAAQIATNTADITQLKSEVSALPTDGVVANSKQLLSENGTDNTEPYMFRAVPVNADRAELDAVVGGTVAWNQLCNGSTVTVQSDRKYLSKIGTAWAVGVSTGTAITGLTSGSDMVIDLTAMFGSTIADYIYNLEQSTAGAGVAFFRKLFPKDYYPYDAGTLKSVEGVSEKVTRDADNNVLGTYPLDSTLTLRGIPKLTDGKLSYDGDRYRPDGTVERRYGIVDLGTLSYVEGSASESRFYTTGVSSLIKKGTDGGMWVVCSKFIATPNLATLKNANNLMWLSSGGNISFSKGLYESASAFKSAMNGVYLIYELATPTTETAEPYQSLQVCDPNGTEEFVTTGIVPVGHETRYPENLRAKIEGLPWDFSSLIAPTEKTTTASRNYTTGALLIMNNVLYKVTANIANGGTITPNTNVTATTLSEVISALQ